MRKLFPRVLLSITKNISRHGIYGTSVLTALSLLLTITIQLGIWRTLPQGAFWGSDSGAKFLQTINFSVTSQAIAYPGRVVDPSLRFTPLVPIFFFTHDDHFYGIYNVLFIALSALNYHLFGFAGLSVLSVLAYFITLLLAVLLVQKVAPEWQPITAPVIGLMTPLLFYSMLFWEHALGVACVTGSLVLLYTGIQQARRSYFFLAGVVAGLGFAFRVELGAWCLAMLVSAILIWPASRWHMLLAFSIGVALIVIIFQLYDVVTFGSWLPPNIAVNYDTSAAFQNLPSRLRQQLAFMAVMLLPGERRSLWLILWGTTGGLLILARFARVACLQLVTRLSLLIVTAGIVGLHVLTLGSRQGFADLVQTTPLLSLFPAVLVAPRRPFAPHVSRWLHFLWLTIGIFVLLVMLTAPNDGVAQWGPRYLLAIVPVAMTLLFSYLSHVNWKRLVRGGRWGIVAIVITLIIASVGVNGRGISSMRSQIALQRQMIKMVEVLPEHVIAVNSYVTMVLLAPIFNDKLFFLVDTPDDAAPFLSMLLSSNIDKFAYVTLNIMNKDGPPQLLDICPSSCCLQRQQQQTLHAMRNINATDVFLVYTVQRFSMPKKGAVPGQAQDALAAPGADSGCQG